MPLCHAGSKKSAKKRNFLTAFFYSAFIASTHFPQTVFPCTIFPFSVFCSQKTHLLSGFSYFAAQLLSRSQVIHFGRNNSPQTLLSFFKIFSRWDFKIFLSSPCNTFSFSGSLLLVNSSIFSSNNSVPTNQAHPLNSVKFFYFKYNIMFPFFNLLLSAYFMR